MMATGLAWRWIAVAALVLSGLAGCMPLATNPDDFQLLSVPKMSPDAVIVESALVQTDLEPSAEELEFWRTVDEMQIPADVRRRLADAGLRCGVTGVHLSDWVRQQLSEQQKHIELEEKDSTAVLSNVPMQQRFQCRSGQQRVIRLADTQDLLSLPEDDGNNEATELEQAACEIAFTAAPMGNGRVEVQLTPQIEHGPARQRWVADKGSFRIDSTRDCRRFEELSARVEIRPGQTVVFSATLPPHSLGKTLFCSSESAQRRRILLIRLVQTQLDDLFSELDTAPPIATEAQ